MKNYSTKHIGKQTKSVRLLKYIYNFIQITFSLLQAFMIAKIISFATGKEIKSVVYYSIIWIILLIFFELVLFGLRRKIKYVYEVTQNRCRIDLLTHLFEQKMSKLNEYKEGELLQRIEDDFFNVYDKISILKPELYSNIFSCIVYGGVLLWKNMLIAFIIFIISLLQIIPPLFEKKVAQKYYEQDQLAEADLSECIMMAYKGNKTIKLFNAFGWYEKYFRKKNSRAMNIGKKSATAYRIGEAINNFVEIIMSVISYIIVGYFILLKVIGVNSGVYVIALAPSLFTAMRKCFNIFPQRIVLKEASKRIEMWYEPLGEETRKYINKIRKISLKNVGKKAEKQILLQEVNLELPLDSITVISGNNGTGKTSFIKTIMGIISIDKGQILYNGVPQNKIIEKSIIDNFFYMGQIDEIVPFSPEELFELISDSKKEKMINLAKEFGLNVQCIREKKICELSGGERKKVYLSIAFAQEEKVLILDEPSNSLDNKTIDILVEKIKQYKNGVIVVSHDKRIEKLGNRRIVFSERGRCYSE